MKKQMIAVVSLMTLAGAVAFAQNTPATGGAAPTAQSPNCQNIINACTAGGYVKGEWKQKKGLYKDCVGVFMRNPSATVPNVSGGGNVAVQASDVQACKQWHKQHKGQKIGE